MPEGDRLLATIEAVHAAGLRPELWPQALAGIARAVGGIAATLETFDRPSGQITEFHSYGLPTGNDVAYFDEYAMRNPRIPFLINGRPGDIVFDSMVLDERAMEHDDFYAGFLAPTGYRYYVGGTLEVGQRESSLFSVQRTRKQGHVDCKEIALMRLLLPHMQQAFDTMRRLRTASTAQRALEGTLDWLTDGAALVRADGTVLYANQALQAIARQGDGVCIRRKRLDFLAADAAARYPEGLAAATRNWSTKRPADGVSDFTAARLSGATPFLVAIRPLPRASRHRIEAPADAVVFVRDPLQKQKTSIEILREAFHFTPAEVALARALQDGTSVAGYAQHSALSLNTVYTHLRRIREKTGSRRMADLLRKLDELCGPLRPE
jgi:DNA-binding CsgD family transcriptional regulator/PAS domain-containing protein